MHAREDIRAADVAHHHGDVLFVLEPNRARPCPARFAGPIDNDAKLAVLRGEPCVGVPLKHAGWACMAGSQELVNLLRWTGHGGASYGDLARPSAS